MRESGGGSVGDRGDAVVAEHAVPVVAQVKTRVRSPGVALVQRDQVPVPWKSLEEVAWTLRPLEYCVVIPSIQEVLPELDAPGTPADNAVLVVRRWLFLRGGTAGERQERKEAGPQAWLHLLLWAWPNRPREKGGDARGESDGHY